MATSAKAAAPVDESHGKELVPFMAERWLAAFFTAPFTTGPIAVSIGAEPFGFFGLLFPIKAMFVVFLE